jgi:hypothetical protein
MSDHEPFGPLETTTIDLGFVAATVAVNAGPRVLGYARTDGPNLFASLPDEVIEHAAVGTFRFLGGHRLWRAPEVPAVSYMADDAPVTIANTEAGVEIVGPADGDGIVKAITLAQHGDFTAVDHELRNEGWSPLRLAPWAITQLAPGGTAYLPQRSGPVDDDGVLPNRHLVLWPYTDLSSPEITVRRDLVTVEASDREAKSKIGISNRRGWIAYARGGELFVKWAALHRDDDVYVDFGASAQCYRDERFIELETLGPLVTLQPGKRAAHREVWTLRNVPNGALDDVLDSLPSVPGGLPA